MEQVAAAYVSNPFDFMDGKSSLLFDEGTSISAMAKKFSNADEFLRPTICVFNGVATLRADWHTEIGLDDTVVFVSVPQGGDGGSDPLRLILMIALIVVAPNLAPGLAEALEISEATATSLIAFGGTVLISAILPPPSAPTPDSLGAATAPSPTYSLNAQGNSARLQSPIPVIYGTHKIYPDYASTPYAIYHNNDQYLHQVFIVGAGEHTIEEIKVGDTPIEVFGIKEATTIELASGLGEAKYVTATNADRYQLIQPVDNSSRVALFYENVVSSAEVSGQELRGANDRDVESVDADGVETFEEGWVGPFILGVPREIATHIGIDIALPRGLYYATDSGGLSDRTVEFQFQYQRITDTGIAISGWSDLRLSETTITKATNTPQRITYTVAVPAGRHSIRARRTNDKSDDNRVSDVLNWIGARAYLRRELNYGNVTVLAMKLRASDNLSQQSSRSINLVAKRKIQNIRQGASSYTADSYETSSIASVLLDICKNKEYGGGLENKHIDLNTLQTLDAWWGANNYFFNAVFDRKLAIWEALTLVARVGRAVPIIRAGVLTFVRDKKETMVTGMFTMNNIVANTLRITYVLPADELANAINVEYFDAESWGPKIILVEDSLLPEPSDNFKLPTNVKLFGCTNANQAEKEGRYLLNANKYRRKAITFQTELEGFIPTYGSLISISHDMPSWGISGTIMAAGVLTAINRGDGSSHILTKEQLAYGTADFEVFQLYETSQALPFEENERHYVALRKRDGSVYGPLECRPNPNTANGFKLVIPIYTPYPLPPVIDIDIGNNREPTHFSFGKGETFQVKAKVKAIKPRGELKVEIEAVEDIPEAYPLEPTEHPVFLLSFALPISEDMQDLDIYHLLGQSYAGDRSVPVRLTVTVDSGVTISASNPGVPALSIGGFHPNSLITLINNGRIIGAGGNGGQGRSVRSGNSGVGERGGDAIDCSLRMFALNITNTATGSILGGGGGGGGGGGTGYIGVERYIDGSGGGGGGGAGLAIGLGGLSRNQQEPQSGNDGNETDGGRYGIGYRPNAGSSQDSGGNGGNGGNLGEAGANGRGARYRRGDSSFINGAKGGKAGYAIRDFSSLTKENTGLPYIAVTGGNSTNTKGTVGATA